MSKNPLENGNLNSLDLLCSIEEEGENKYLNIQIVIDGEVFGSQYAVDLREIYSSLDCDGNYEIFTCGCGVAGCAGIFEDMEVKKRSDVVEWKASKEFFGFVENVNDTPLEERQGHWIFSFSFEDYSEKIYSLLANAKDCVRKEPDIKMEIFDFHAVDVFFIGEDLKIKT